MGCVSKLCKCNRASIKSRKKLKHPGGDGVALRGKKKRKNVIAHCFVRSGIEHFQQKCEAVLRLDNATEEEFAFPAKVRSGFASGQCDRGRVCISSKGAQRLCWLENVAAEQIGVVRRFQ
ncbi:hypothetical protein HED55_06530 [Ochrobactrum haematophilum]|uniref:Uncharacterized protein n=1 Tax=Brucella haematophila TaxID=419474 RepID=A0ABX1DJR6_9HYPH|nr:hypothetical protein [Brucella haematophila]